MTAWGMHLVWNLAFELKPFELFVKQGRNLATLELLHERLSSIDGSRAKNSSYPDSHPGADERIQLIRKNQQTAKAR